MGWGCYEHHWDEGSEAWKEYYTSLAEQMLERRETWGRDSAICPKCYLGIVFALKEVVGQVSLTEPHLLRSRALIHAQELIRQNPLRQPTAHAFDIAVAAQKEAI